MNIQKKVQKPPLLPYFYKDNFRSDSNDDTISNPGSNKCTSYTIKHTTLKLTSVDDEVDEKR